jgi:alkaline phosphatase D
VKARQLSNPEMSPHLSFVDTGGHGYAVVHVTSKQIETEFVGIPRPIERSQQPDGGPLLYRVRFRAELWEKGKSPKLETRVLEGDPRFSV